MAADGTSIKNDIDNELGNKGYRGIRITMIISTLKKVVDWVASAVANNVSTWLRTSDDQPGGANNEAIYRTGAVSTFGGLYAKVVSAAGGSSMGEQGFGVAGIQVVGKQNGWPAFMEFHVPGMVIHQLGVDSDTTLKFRPYTSAKAYSVVIDRITEAFALKSTVGNRKLVLFDVGEGNPHQFYGFGVDLAGLLRYQAAEQANGHAFYAGSSPATSVEIMRIMGNGNVSIGDTNANFRFKAIDNNPANGWVAIFGNSKTTTGRTGAKVAFDQSGLSTWSIGQPAGDVDAFVIEGAGLTERLRINSLGNVGIGTAAPTSKLHVKGTGFSQFRLENTYTPTGVNDPNGQKGDTCWDNNYFYIKSPDGWRRAAITGGW